MSYPLPGQNAGGSKALQAEIYASPFVKSGGMKRKQPVASGFGHNLTPSFVVLSFPFARLSYTLARTWRNRGTSPLEHSNT